MLVSLTAVAWYASSALRTFCLEQTKADLEARALLVEDQFLSKIVKSDIQQIDALCKELGQKAATRITVILPDGKVAGDSDESPQKMDNHADRPEVVDALAGAQDRTNAIVTRLKNRECMSPFRLEQVQM